MDLKEMVNTEPIEKLVEKLGANSVFGEPTKEKDTIVIPVAEVSFGFGYGGGFSEGQAALGKKSGAGGDKDASGLGNAGGEGGGSGGGAGGRSTPRGYIRISKDDVAYEPIMNPIVIPLAGIAMGGWTIFWVTLTVRHIAKLVAKTRQSAIKKG